ncbi:helix-turn-helix transcriptional regulator [Streptomyces sp. NPDC090442]|uniref:helix-turn-helix transcriptional regulator n=1 Tax=Streptomyces sp. NPDC090442 TaxID=3365962 RepID=UPI00381C62AA
MTSDRLLSVLLLLQTRGRVPVSELADRLEVSVRTIYRDIDALATTGVPAYAERGRRGGIAMLPGFRTDVTGLTEDESRASFVLAAQAAHAALGLDGALSTALRKVMAALSPPHRPAAELTSLRIFVDPKRWMSGQQSSAEPDLGVLTDAVFGDRRLRLRYRHSGQEQPRTYTVDPYGLVAKPGTRYLVADYRGRGRLFRSGRIISAGPIDAPVQRRPGVEPADVREALRREVEALRAPAVLVTARVRRSRLDSFVRVQGAYLTAPPDESHGAWVDVELGDPELGAVRQLLAFGTDVEVLFLSDARAVLAVPPPKWPRAKHGRVGLVRTRSVSGESPSWPAAAVRATRVIERVTRQWPWSMRRWHSWQAAGRFSTPG